MTISKYILGPAVALALALPGCSTINNNKGNGHPIEHIEKSRYIGGVTIEYEPPSLMIARNEKEAELSLSTPEPIRSKGGQIVVILQGSGLEAARGSHLEMVLVRDGEEISRRRGSGDTPNIPSGRYGHWWSVQIMPVPDPIEEGYVDLYVVHTAHEQRDHFRIHARD